MAGTRQSSRLAGNDSSPKTDVKSSPQAGSKRKAEAEASPNAKRGKNEPRQQTLEETLVNDSTDDASKNENRPKDIEMQDAAAEGEGTDKPVPADVDESKKDEQNIKASDNAKTDGTTTETKPDADEIAEMEEMAKKADDAEAAASTNGHTTQNGTEGASKVNGNQGKTNPQSEGNHTNGHADAPNTNGTTSQTNGASSKTDETVSTTNGTESSTEDTESNTNAKKSNESEAKANGTSRDDGGVIEHAPEREKIMPSNILEKGIIYFITRGRVGIDDPDSVQDLQRTHFVLRPIPKGGKIGEGAVEDDKSARLIALPKKVFPKSGRDKFMVFVEKSGVSMKELKDDVFSGSEYETKTVGTRQAPPVAPIGEGVYALTTTGSTSHLSYILTIPKELQEVQKDMGLKQQGSFITSLKNPNASGPSYASLPEKPDFPEEFVNDFSGRSWMPITKPEYLNYPNAQLLLIGEDAEKGLEPIEKDQKHDKETPQEELEKLENEDQIRVEHLKGDDTIFADLGLSKDEYPDVMTTW